MVEKVRKNIKALIATINTSTGSIQFFRFKPVHTIALTGLGLLLAIPTATTLINAAVPLSWEKVSGVVSTVTQNEAVSGGRQYVATVIYRLNDKTYSIREEYAGDRPARDDQVVVYFNPASPDKAMVQHGGPLLFLAWIPLLAGLGLIILAGVQQYKAWRHIKSAKDLATNGKLVPALVKDVQVIDKKSFIHKTLYKNFIFFKLKAAPITSSIDTEPYESDLLMWQGKMYGDVATLKEQSMPVSLYVDNNNPRLYYLEPPKIESDESAVETDEESNDTAQIPSEPITMPAGYSSIQVPETVNHEDYQVSLGAVATQEIVESPAPLGLSVEQSEEPKDTQVLGLAAPEEEDLALEDINKLEESLVGFNIAPAAIDLNFADDPENINNLPTPSPVQSNPTSAPAATPAPEAQFTSAPAPIPVGALPIISGISSQANKSQPTTTNEVAPALSRTPSTGHELVINPIANISESMTPRPTPAPIQTVAPSPVSTSVATVSPTPTPVVSRADTPSSSRGERRISVPRR